MIFKIVLSKEDTDIKISLEQFHSMMGELKRFYIFLSICLSKTLYYRPSRSSKFLSKSGNIFYSKTYYFLAFYLVKSLGSSFNRCENIPIKNFIFYITSHYPQYQPNNHYNFPLNSTFFQTVTAKIPILLFTVNISIYLRQILANNAANNSLIYLDLAQKQ